MANNVTLGGSGFSPLGRIILEDLRDGLEQGIVRLESGTDIRGGGRFPQLLRLLLLFRTLFSLCLTSFSALVLGGGSGGGGEGAGRGRRGRCGTLVRRDLVCVACLGGAFSGDDPI